jgi:PAS domain S-box-containing protein
MIDNLQDLVSNTSGEEWKAYQQILDNTAVIVLLNSQGSVSYVNHKYCEVSGFDRNDVTGLDLKRIFTDIPEQQNLKEIWDHLQQGKSWKGEILARKKDERFFWLDATINPIEKYHEKPHQFILLGTDITSFKNALQIKDQFLANMSHEFRTPLHTIYSLGNLLSETPLTKEQNDYMDSILNATGILMRMVEDLLDLNKIETGKVRIETRSFNPQLLIQSLARMFSEKTRRKSIDFSLEYDATLPEYVLGDPHRLKQILMHLLDNAVKCTSQGHIHLSCRPARRENGHAEFLFVVEDTGIGIPKESLEMIQEKFQQVHSGNTRPFGGPGLGLSIVKQLIELHKGEFRIESAEEKGTRVSFSIPYKEAGITEKEREVITPEVAEEKTEEFSVKNHTVNGQPIKVLIAEDADINQLVIRKHMQILGFEADFADNGKIALEKLRNKKYDIVLMDMQMPVMDGYQAIKSIRNDFAEPVKNIPIISITASVMREASGKCLEVGADDYMPKPYDVSELKTKMEKWITKNQYVSKSTKAVMQEDHKSHNSESLIDLEYLEQLSEGDNDFTISMLTYFIDNTPGVIDEMKQYYKEKDFKALRNVAHKFKPQLTFMGIKSIFQDVENMEQYANTGTNIDAIPELIQRTEEVCMKALVEIKAELDKML